jgi:ABC-2 type transport system permease protein
MTATLSDRELPVADELKVTQARVARSELTKFISLRSSVITLAVAVALTAGIGTLFSAVTASQYHTFSAADRLNFNPVSTSLNGTFFAQLAVGVLGVLFITGEYHTGMIRSSLTAVPRRLPVLWGKLAVFTGIALVVTLLSSFAAFFLGQAMFSGHHLQASLSTPGALRMVVGSALYVTVVGIMGIAIGTLLRSTAAAISTLVGLFFVLPIIVQLLPSSLTDHFVQYLPSDAGQALWSTSHMGSGPVLSPWSGFSVMCLWAAGMVVLAALRLRASDA